MRVNSNQQGTTSVIDGVLSSQPELGPKIPDGGYGWIVFAATLFFQMFIPSLIVAYGLLLSSAKLTTELDPNEILHLWDDNLIYVPLLFIMSWTIFDPTARQLISHSTWPRLICQAGNCLTCAGLLFVWMGMAGKQESMLVSNKIWFMLAGFVSGFGSAIQVAQCEILLAQYFKLRHLCLKHISHAVIAFGFMVTPNIIAQLRMKYTLLNVVLIYQAIIIQGIFINIAFKKPEYLKSKMIRYHYVVENGEDEEDIFSKSLTELRVKTRDVLKRIDLKNNTIINEATPSTSNHNIEEMKKDWVKFNDEEINAERKSWERFEDQEEQNPTAVKDEINVVSNENLNPTPLFSEINRVNMNTTYAFDDNIEHGPRSLPSIFAEAEKLPMFNMAVYRKILSMPTFYKSLITVITTKYSIFLFYALFPSYLYVQVTDLRFKKSAILVGGVSLVALIFSAISYWLNITKQKRPAVLFLSCWIGANGYFLIASYKHDEYVVMFGAAEIVLSIASLQHIGGPLVGLTIRGESNSEYTLLCILTGISFFIFFFIDLSFRDCFLFMALLQIITGLLWVFNFFYKKFRQIQGM